MWALQAVNNGKGEACYPLIQFWVRLLLARLASAPTLLGLLGAALLQAGTALGLAAAAYLLKDNKNAKPIHYLGGASVGATGGLLLHMLTRPHENSPNKMLHELVN